MVWATAAWQDDSGNAPKYNVYEPKMFKTKKQAILALGKGNITERDIEDGTFQGPTKYYWNGLVMGFGNSPKEAEKNCLSYLREVGVLTEYNNYPNMDTQHRTTKIVRKFL